MHKTVFIRWNEFHQVMSWSGFCVIINIVNFDDNTEMERCHSIESVYLISETFKYLNFKVKSFEDLKDHEIKFELNELLNNEECQWNYCFVFYIDSHGKVNQFITANNSHSILYILDDYYP